MVQDIITLLIIAAAAGYVLWSVITSKKGRRPSSCGDCTGCSCELAELKQKCKVQN